MRHGLLFGLFRVSLEESGGCGFHHGFSPDGGHGGYVSGDGHEFFVDVGVVVVEFFEEVGMAGGVGEDGH